MMMLYHKSHYAVQVMHPLPEEEEQEGKMWQDCGGYTTYTDALDRFVDEVQQPPGLKFRIVRVLQSSERA